MSKLTLAAVQALITDQSKTLMEEITSLRAEVATLRTLLDEECNKRQGVPPADALANKQSFADVVKSSIKTAMCEESAKKEVVLNLPENKRDHQDMDDLCQRSHVTMKPSSIARIGEQKPDHTRPLKASFPTSFDARTFISKVDTRKMLLLKTLLQKYVADPVALVKSRHVVPLTAKRYVS
jgi:hypothetical protein